MISERTTSEADSTISGRRVRGLNADERRAQRRDDLLAAAFDLFADEGYSNVSIEQICQRAYVSTKSFYESFASKESCYLDLFTQIAETLQAQMVDALQASPGVAPDGMSRLVETFGRNLLADPRVPKVEFGECSAVSPAVERQRRVNRRTAATFIEAVWRQYGVIGSKTKAIDPHRIAIGFIGGMFDLIGDWLQDNDPTKSGDVDALIRDLVQFHDVTTKGLTVAGGK